MGKTRELNKLGRGARALVTDSHESHARGASGGGTRQADREVD
jgi:hypothetical protein